ncbi:MAG: IPT/TIG domain-containing protein [Dehalococcoidia bacterium]|nr:IPT/TIG domain-containing protein [Dehalococcoidia bacterium]
MHRLWLRAQQRIPWSAAALCAALLLVFASAAAEAAPAPSITSISPSSAPLVGGTPAVITGTGFAAGASVDFGGQPGVVTNVTASQIEVTTPARAPGEVVVTVSNPDGQSATLSGAFRFLGPPPTLTAVSPASGPTTGATSIMLTGAEFAAGATVSVGGRAATAVSITSATSATARTPWGVVGGVDVVYKNADGQSASLPGAFTYTQAAPPTVSSLSPSAGTHGGGTPVTITGTGFAPGATVRFGTAAPSAATFVSATSIRATAPAGVVGQSVSVTVTNADSQTATRLDAFTYFEAPAPTVTIVTPSTGAQAGGTAVTVIGSNFNAGAVVTFGSVAGTVLSVTSSQITVLAPAQPNATRVDVTVTNSDSKHARATGAFTYVQGPTLTKVSPASGSSAGGRSVTLTGTNFRPGMAVLVNGAAASHVEVTGTTSATALTPAGSGLATVTVRNPDGQTGHLAAAYLYLSPPRVTTVTPAAGPGSGGTRITITGSGFGAGAEVLVGEEAARDVVVVNGQEIRAVVPASVTPGKVTFARVSVVMPGNLASVDDVSFVYTVGTGTITSGTIPSRGIGLITFSGGPTSLLVSTALASACPDIHRLSFFASDGRGAFVGYIASAPPFVNVAWLTRFADGLPAGQALVARCS